MTGLNGLDRRMFLAASASGFSGIGAAALGIHPVTLAAHNGPMPTPAGSRLAWPQHTPATPYVHAADFGLKPASPDKMKVEHFGQNPDATEALQKALDGGAGGRVYIPPGAYRVTRPLLVRTGTTVMGAGFCASMLLSEKPLPAILHVRKVGGPMTILSDLWVAGPMGGQWGATGIWLDNANGVTVHDCWVSALGTGIRVDGISDTWLRHIVFELNQQGIVVQCPTLGWASGNLRLLDCYGYQNYGGGITLNNCRGVQMHCCSATGSAHALLARNCAQITVSGTQVNWDGSPWRKFGIRLENCNYVTLSNSVVEGMVQYGIAAVDCQHLSLQGNVIRNTTNGPGLIVQKCRYGSVVGNCISESAQDGGVIAGCRDLTITGNIADGFGRKPETSAHPLGLRIEKDCDNCQVLANIPGTGS
jgi:hypothetical protein